MKDVRLISAGRILENNKTVGDCRSPVSNLSDAVTTMHVLIQPQVTDKGKIDRLSISSYKTTLDFAFQAFLLLFERISQLSTVMYLYERI